jgi:hypothetical protein
MPRWEDTVPTGLGDIGRFVDGDERRELAGEPLRLVEVTHDPFGKFGPRWIVSAVVMGTGEKIAIGLAANPNRDRQLTAARDALAAGTDVDPVVLETRKPVAGGNAFWTFRSATDDELADVPPVGADDGDDEDGDEPSSGGPPEEMPGETIAKAKRGK